MTTVHTLFFEIANRRRMSQSLKIFLICRLSTFFGHLPSSYNGLFPLNCSRLQCISPCHAPQTFNIVLTFKGYREFDYVTALITCLSCEHRPIAKEIFFANAMLPSKSEEPRKNLLSVSL